VVKAQLKVLEVLQVEVKELKAIPHYYPYPRAGFPKYELTVGDICSGATFICFVYEKSTTNAVLSAEYLYAHLTRNGLDLSQVTFHTDNGTELGHPYNAHSSPLALKLISSLLVLKRLGVAHSPITPGTKTYNSDMEAFHSLIENEFFDWKDYSSSMDFSCAAYDYLSYFNLTRINRYKDRKNPAIIMAENSAILDPQKIFDFKPFILDHLIHANLKHDRGVYHIPESDSINNFSDYSISKIIFMHNVQ